MTKKGRVFLTAFLLLLGFIVLSYFVAEGRFVNSDFDLTVKIQDKIPHSFDGPFSTLSILAQSEVIGWVWLGLLIFSLAKRYWLTFISLFTLPLALFIELLGKLYIHHPAPPHLLYRGIFEFTFPTHYVHTNYSYPSGHVLRTAFIVCFLVGFLYLKADRKSSLLPQIGLLTLLLLMVVSRVYLGEHWTSDVIGGVLLGGGFGLLSAWTLPRNSKLSN